METQLVARVREMPTTRTPWLGGESTRLRANSPAIAKKIADAIDSRVPRDVRKQQDDRAQTSAE